MTLLKELCHANIVTLHDIIPTSHSLTLVFEYCSQDLKQVAAGSSLRRVRVPRDCRA